jgi:Sulfotransferase family
MVNTTSFLRLPLDADELIERARRHVRLSDFGETPFREGLQVFLDACAAEAKLSLFGYFGTRWDVVRFLSNLLRLRHEERAMPEILAEPIERPLFILGLPRSGTTFLHQLLAADPNNQVPRVWQLIHPYPELQARSSRDHRRQRVARQLRMFRLLAPQFHSLHPIGADSPQECSEITAHVFASLRFGATYAIPSYGRWLDRIGHLDAYRFHRRFLQHLQRQAGARGRWVLKCPDHIFALGAIRAAYPDARLVFMHRDPLRALVSVTRLTEVLRRPFTRRIDRATIGREELDRWSAGTDLMIRAADEEAFAEPIHHIHYRELVSDPLAAVQRLYRHFGLVLEPEAADHITRKLESNPTGGYGANRYSFEIYEIDAGEARERFAPYMARFNVAPEYLRTASLPAPAPG